MPKQTWATPKILTTPNLSYFTGRYYLERSTTGFGRKIGNAGGFDSSLGSVARVGKDFDN